MVSDLSKVEIALSTFDGMSGQSRVWIWQAKVPLDENHEGQARKKLQEFVASWVSHSRALSAKADVILGRFFVVVLDQTISGGASGCSIDSLTHAIQRVADSLNVDVMDRTTFCFYKKGRIIDVAMKDLSRKLESGALSKDDLVFDNLIKTKVELDSRWLKPLQESWHYRFV